MPSQAPTLIIAQNDLVKMNAFETSITVILIDKQDCMLIIKCLTGLPLDDSDGNASAMFVIRES